jgi:predicted lactoylglutathione lyase
MTASPLGFFVKVLVLDRTASAAFYEKLGFVRVGSDATFTHLRWEERGDVLLVSAPVGVRVDGKRGWGVLLSFTSQTELATIAERAAELTAPMDGPELKPWHTRELVVTDPDGYRLNFVQPA